MAIQFVTGQRLTANLMNANIYDFMPVTYGKTSNTARTSTTTLADDPDLSGIALAIGTWEIEFRGYFTLTTTATQKIKTRWGFTGTAADANRMCIGLGSTNTASADAATVLNSVSKPWASQDAVYQKDAGAAYGAFREIVSEFTVTVAGNFSIQWAQSASNANATNLMNSSAVVIRKVR